MRITGDFLGTTEKMLLIANRELFISITPSIQIPSRFLVILNLNKVMKGFSTGVKYEVVRTCHC